MNRITQSYGSQDDALNLADASQLVMQAYATATNGGAAQSITLGWAGLDALTGGAQPGEVVTWVARPNVGKSYTAARVATRAWLACNSILFVTMEMQAVAMARRLLGVVAGTNPDWLKRGTLSPGVRITFTRQLSGLKPARRLRSSRATYRRPSRPSTRMSKSTTRT